MWFHFLRTITCVKKALLCKKLENVTKLLQGPKEFFCTTTQTSAAINAIDERTLTTINAHAEAQTNILLFKYLEDIHMLKYYFE